MNKADYTDEDIYYIKQGVKNHEYEMHRHVNLLGIVNSPKIVNYDAEKEVMVMEKIDNMNVSDYYDEYAKGVPKPLMKKIQKIIKTLYDNNIVYPDFVIKVSIKDSVYLQGLTMDWVKKGLNEGFDFVNPNERDRCGCGESFRI